MNELVKEIAKLRYKATMIEFKDYLSEEDKKSLKSLENKVKSLESQLPNDLVSLKLVDKKGDWFYLSADDLLCCSSEPTWFDSDKEALEYLEKAKIDNKSGYELIFERRKE
jgi:hypothetical protein